MGLEYYRRPDGKWIVREFPDESEFDTEPEAHYYALTGIVLSAVEAAKELINMTMKEQWVTQALVIATKLARVVSEAADSEEVFFDRGYQAGGGNPITDDDLTNFNVMAEQLSYLVSLFGAYMDFVDNVAVGAGDRRLVLNQARTDT